MNSIAAKPNEAGVFPFLPARNLAQTALPWIPLAEGKSFKPLRFLSGNRGFAELLRIEPGTIIPLHRHSGEIHAFNLEGWRGLCSGELIGPGDYVYEPAGNVDSWRVVGEVPCVIFVTVSGSVEFLGPDNTVTRSVSADTLMEIYRQYCTMKGIETLDLVD
jgi:quercetin dioxygenase-like cupin family protein